MQYGNWIAQARQHWREHQPKRFKALKESGQLEQALAQAAEATAEAMQRLADEGFDRDQAWEMVRQEHLFPAEEPTTEPRLQDNGAYSTARQINAMMSRLGE